VTAIPYELKAERTFGVPRAGAPEKRLDLRLLVALDALLQEESVTGAAERLQISTPAMSRILNRIRRALDDTVLVRDGRRMVPTPRAVALRERVHTLVREAEDLFTPGASENWASARCTFGIVADPGCTATVAPALAEEARVHAPGFGFQYMPGGPLELLDGTADVAVQAGGYGPQVGLPGLTVTSLFATEYLGFVSASHPRAGQRLTPEEFAALEHVTVRGRLDEPVERALGEFGLCRHRGATLPDAVSALLLVARSQTVAVLPAATSRAPARALGLRTVPLPVALPTVDVYMAWRTRDTDDRAHRWVRDTVAEVMRAASAD
jgi:DNA-binding transcriptional LysR family regulator